ncbi:MAG: hypothetical protein SPI36_02300 [Candidatus Onthovivens sp.]|nr:hypothetical protein [Candidatus Onthovivens sp.]
MVKYTYKTVTYVLPESIKKINNDVRLQRAQGKKEDIKNEINNVDNKINDIDDKIKKAKTKNEKIQLENQKKEHEYRKDELRNELTKIENNIFDIKADLYGSTVNFNNSNIRNLSANINDIKSVIKDTSKLNDNIVKSVSEILTNQINVNNIFDTDNFKDFLESIKNEVDPGKKFNYPEEFDKLSKALEQFKNSLKTNEENSEIWKSIKTSVENLIPTEKLNNIINNYTEKINDIISLKTNLAKRIFGEDIDDVSDKDLNSYIKNFNLLNDLFNKAEPIINNKELGDLANSQMNKKIHIPKNEHFIEVLNNLRKWFSEDVEIDTGILKSPKNLFISNMNTKKLWNENIKDIDPNIIKEADLLIESIKDYKNKNKSKSTKVNDPQKQDSEDSNEDDNKSEGLQKQCLSKGLDLDEIHNMNVMNNIIKSLDNIIYNQNRIIELMSNRSSSKDFSKQAPQSKQSFSERKLGRFKVEKYNPNMSITEFKKLFDKK